MTDTQAQIVQLQTRIDLYQFALSQTTNAEHANQLRKAIAVTTKQINELSI